MLRRLSVLCCLALLPVCQLGYGAQVSRPVWAKGDSWTVKCADMSYHPGVGALKIGEYSVVIKVLGIQKSLNGTECYVLEVRPGSDLPEHMKQHSDLITEHVFYTTDALDLAQIERWKLDESGKESWLGREVSTEQHPLPLVYFASNGSWIPLLLPHFPLARGNSARLCRTEYKDKETKRRAAKGEDVAVSFLGDAVVEGPEGKDASIAGAERVTFRATTVRSASGAMPKKKAEQIWAPGRRWWSVARLYESSTQVIEFTLVE